MAGPDGDQGLGGPAVRFEPLRPASRARLIAGLVLGPILWLVALTVAAWLYDESPAIALGFAVTVASFVIALLVLSLLYLARRRQEKRFADGG
jgi:Na+/proline symporter